MATAKNNVSKTRGSNKQPAGTLSKEMLNRHKITNGNMVSDIDTTHFIRRGRGLFKTMMELDVVYRTIAHKVTQKRLAAPLRNANHSFMVPIEVNGVGSTYTVEKKTNSVVSEGNDPRKVPLKI